MLRHFMVIQRLIKIIQINDLHRCFHDDIDCIVIFYTSCCEATIICVITLIGKEAILLQKQRVQSTVGTAGEQQEWTQSNGREGNHQGLYTFRGPYTHHHS